MRGPGLFSADASVLRKFRIRGDRLVLQLEGQVFNLANRTNFNIPELYADEPATFGRILSARAPRQAQVSARIIF